MRILYHYTSSPFSRRTRLALAHKGLDCELREARENPAWLEQARRLVAVKTIPVFVDGDRPLADSLAITRWLDAVYPECARIWPCGDEALEALEITTLVDLALTNVIDLGTRYYALHEHPAWGAVKDEMLGRSVRALEALAARAQALGRPTFAASGWSGADMWLYTAVAWAEGLPARAPNQQNIAQVLSLGWRLPAPLSRWADAHRSRADVTALG
jgi:glutathione S-transferase